MDNSLKSDAPRDPVPQGPNTPTISDSSPLIPQEHQARHEVSSPKHCLGFLSRLQSPCPSISLDTESANTIDAPDAAEVDEREDSISGSPGLAMVEDECVISW